MSAETAPGKPAAMRIGVFGGSFNPIHVAHVALGRELLAKGDLDELWYMVSPHNPLKESADLMDERLRLELVRLALQEDDRLKASDFEFHLPRPSYTVNTLAALRAAYPQHEFALVIGADNVLAFSRWRDTDEILRHHRVLVYRRPGYDIKHLPQGMTLIETDLYDISSTDIREAMSRPGYRGEGLPPEVWKRLQK